MSNSNTRTFLLSAITSVGLAFGVATAAAAASPVASAIDDPSYQAYEQLNGFSIPAGRSVRGANTAASQLSSYERYLYLNGFAVEHNDAVNVPDTVAGKSLREYQYLNGFL
jgi:hypothetical protein